MDQAVVYNRYLLDRLVSWAGAKTRLLDFGAGNGRFAIGLKKTGCDVHAIESDPALRARITSHGIPTHSSVDDLDPKPFEGIYTLNVLEHIEADEAMLARFNDRIRPGGGLFVYVPAFEVLFSANDTRVGHVRRYRRTDLVTKLENAGFRVESARYVDCIGFAAALAYRVFGDRDGNLNPGAIRFYDRCIFPISRILDNVFGVVLGKNLLVIATKPAGSASGESQTEPLGRG